MDLKCASPFREKGAVRVPLLLWTRPDNPARFHVVECLVSISEKRGWRGTSRDNPRFISSLLGEC